MSPAAYSLIFLTLGVLLVFAEVLIPSFGLVGIMAIASMLYGARIAWENYGPIWGFAAMAGGGLIALAGVVLFLKSGASKRLVLTAEQAGAPSEIADDSADLVGRVGTAVSDLRPAGIARIDGRRVDVLAAEGEYIEAGVAIVVARIAQNSVVVVRHEPEG